MQDQDEFSMTLEDFCLNLSLEGFDTEQICKLLAQTLENSQNLQEDLLNLLGFENIEAISWLLENRSKIALPTKKVPLKSCNSHAPKYPHVFSQSSHTGFLTDFGTKFSLPVGTLREDTADYEIVTTPCKKTISKFNIPVISISEFNTEASRKAFQGYSCLNPMQSAVFPMAYKTNENLLVCAPTGSGKTDVATMAILRVLEEFVSRMSDFKIIYIAPMKALVNEIVQKFTKKLASYHLKVREYSGDVNLSKKDINSCQMIVSTPEKWDVITRKGTENDQHLVSKVCLIILDEVHLLNDSRGPVIESIVTRTHRQVEITQKLVRIVGLSATLPNFVDVATFLGVNAERGMFSFDDSFRPVPLQQTLVGIKAKGRLHEENAMNEYCFKTCIQNWQNQFQVLLFVHSRNETLKAAKDIVQKLKEEGKAEHFFQCFAQEKDTTLHSSAGKTKNSQIANLLNFGIGIHHAGLPRHERNLMEKLFVEKKIGLLCCTATLAWGVNLPAHSVIIKGTNVYDASRGGFSDLGILDVLQIFGRAGRPQFESFGEAHLLTKHEKLYHYINLLLSQAPIESQFRAVLPDNMNAEIVLGNVSSIEEAVSWLKYSYLYIRMRKNSSAYGITSKQMKDDPVLEDLLRNLAIETCKRLKSLAMITFDIANQIVKPKELGRIASNFYLKIETIEHFVKFVKPNMSEESVLDLLCSCSEFTDSLRCRESESNELEALSNSSNMQLPTRTIPGEVPHKTNVLIQTWISSQVPLNNFALEVDSHYISQNFPRLARAFFQFCLLKGFATSSKSCLDLCQSFEHRLWSHNSHPLLQLKGNLKDEAFLCIKRFSMDQLRSMSHAELVQAARSESNADAIFRLILSFPIPDAKISIQPISNSALRLSVTMEFPFKLASNLYGNSLSYWLNAFDYSKQDYFLYNELITVYNSEPHIVIFIIPVSEPLPDQIFIEICNDQFFGCEIAIPVSYKHLILPQMSPYHTDLLKLDPVPISALNSPILESLYANSFDFFNPIQSQIFHCMFHHHEQNVLLGSPTGSGKTISSELAIWESLRTNPGGKIIYISPLKALVKERLKDWSLKFKPLSLEVVELSGDVTPDLKALSRANIIITTPEKWDGTSRFWKDKKYMENISLVIIDEIHLLGSERGPILEFIVSRMRFIQQHQKAQKIRIVGLSTALANAIDLGEWLGIRNENHFGLFNFRPSVRPIPLKVFIEGFPGVHYCPRMGSMNKPCYNAILNHSPTKPVIIFVSSRRQTRATADGILAWVINSSNPKRFLLPNSQGSICTDSIVNPDVKHFLAFGIGIHHAGLPESDRKAVEQLFLSQSIQLLIATSTLAWGVNFPAHLVIVKGTEYFDGKTGKWIDYPITDVLQMMGRAGRPQFDDSGKALILTQEGKKEFYKKFLYEPFPVESSLPSILAEHLNAEIANGTIEEKKDAVEMLKWTFLYRRIQVNPSYYGVASWESKDVQNWISSLIDKNIDILEESSLVFRKKEPISSTSPGLLREIYVSTNYGRIAAFYYVSHLTIRRFLLGIPQVKENYELLLLICEAAEFDKVPLRHDEDVELEQFYLQFISEFTASQISLQQRQGKSPFSSPNVKAFILLVAHLENVPLPIPDFSTDTFSILDQVVRVIQAFIDICCAQGRLSLICKAIWILQCLKQGISLNSSADGLAIFPFTKRELNAMKKAKVTLMQLIDNETVTIKKNWINQGKLQNFHLVSSFLQAIPWISLKNAQLKNDELTLDLQVVLLQHHNQQKQHSIQSYCPKFPKNSSLVGFLLVMAIISRSAEEASNEQQEMTENMQFLGLKRICIKSNLIRMKLSSFPLKQQHKLLKLMLFVDAYPGFCLETFVEP